MDLLNREAIEKCLRECRPDPKLIELLGDKFLGSAEYHFDGNGNIKLKILPRFGAEIKPAA